jgi:nucleoside-diphosphate-sugar epimerase
MAEYKDVVIVTGSTGLIGSALINKFAGRFALIGLDRAATHQPRSKPVCEVVRRGGRPSSIFRIKRIPLTVNHLAVLCDRDVEAAIPICISAEKPPE